MTNSIKVAIIVAVTALIAVAALIYFSPYHSCMRAGKYPAPVCVAPR
jgi:hypothetical protein